MKIIFSDNSLWSLLHFRGVIIRRFIELGHDVVLVAPKEEISDQKLIDGARIEYINLNRTGVGIKSDIVYCKELCKILRSQKPDVLFNYTIKPTLYGGLIGRLFSIRTISMLAGTGELFSSKRFVFKAVRLLAKFSFRFNHRVVLLNQADYDTLVGRKYVKADKVLLLDGGEGVDVEKYKPRADYVPTERSRKFIMVGRVLYDKGYAEYVEAARLIHKEFPDAQFDMLGYIDFTHPLRVERETIDKDSELGHINYLGTVEDIAGVVGGYDCFVLPSFYNEGMNRSLMEALSLGKVIITTDNKGCREMVADGVNGYLVEPRNVEALTNAVRRVCNASGEELLSMGVQSRKLALDRFSDKIVVDQYEKLIL